MKLQLTIERDVACVQLVTVAKPFKHLYLHVCSERDRKACHVYLRKFWEGQMKEHCERKGYYTSDLLRMS